MRKLAKQEPEGKTASTCSPWLLFKFTTWKCKPNKPLLSLSSFCSAFYHKIGRKLEHSISHYLSSLTQMKKAWATSRGLSTKDGRPEDSTYAISFPNSPNAHRLNHHETLTGKTDWVAHLGKSQLCAKHTGLGNQKLYHHAFPKLQKWHQQKKGPNIQCILLSHFMVVPEEFPSCCANIFFYHQNVFGANNNCHKPLPGVTRTSLYHVLMENKH